jgi:hypothetical protein
MANQTNHTPRHPLSKRVPSHRSESMKTRAMMIFLLLLVPVFALAQDNGRVSGNYNVQQSIELGGHITDTHGNQNVYNTFVNVQDGFRLLDYTLSMRSMNHTGSLVDNLYFSNFGYGGDPNSESRLRVSKNKWYDFSGSFRRDINYSDYNLFGNPFNPANTVVPNSDSIHAMNTRRKMGDFMLTIAPQSPLRVRLGYSRNINEGPSLSSYHEGTDILLFQDYRNRVDRYQFGADWKFAARTQLSFDQYYEHAKVDTNWTDAPFYSEFVSVNPATSQPVPVNLGAIYYPYYNQPCSSLGPGNVPQPILSAPGVVKPNCGIYQHYDRFGPTRTNTPTSQLSFTSNFWKKLDINLQGSYSSAEMNMKTFEENAQVFVTRTNELAYQFTGPARAKRISAHMDGGFTYHINNEWSFSNQTSWLNWRVPGIWDSAETACFSSLASTVGTIFTAPGRAGSATCLGLTTAATPAVYGGSSGADQALETFNRFLGEKSVYNTSTVEWDPTTRFGMHVGYRYGHRELSAKERDLGTLTYYPTGGTTARGACATDGSQEDCSVVIDPTTQVSTLTFGPNTGAFSEELTEHTGMIGFRAMPVDGWRVNADLEMMSANNAFTQISPRNATHFKLRSTYRVSKWGSVSGSINALERKNPADDQSIFPAGLTVPKHEDHSRSYNLSFNVNPKDWIGVDFGWSLLDVISTTGTCMPLSAGAPLEGGPLTACPGGNLPVILRYSNFTNSGYGNVMVKPAKRVTLMFGYDITSDSGANDWLRADTLAPFRVGVTAAGDVLRPGFGTVVGFVDGPNPFQPLGPLAINYHKPSGSVMVDLYKGLAFKAAFEYYDYNEKSQPLGAASFNSTTGTWFGVVPRDFHANVTTLSMRYAF